jgi:predicted signal transduction protein with EAL and GGDEF domain
VRSAVEAIALSNPELRVTASLGVAALPDDGGDADTLVRAADRALYTAKGRGRNRVELFQSLDDAALPEDTTGLEGTTRRRRPGPRRRRGRTRGRWPGPR